MKKGLSFTILVLCWNYPLIANDKFTIERIQQFISLFESAVSKCDAEKFGSFFESTAVIRITKRPAVAGVNEVTLSLEDFKRLLFTNECQYTKPSDTKDWDIEISQSRLTAVIRTAFVDSLAINTTTVPVTVYEEGTLVLNGNQPKITSYVAKIEIQNREVESPPPDQNIIVDPNFAWPPIHL